MVSITSLVSPVSGCCLKPEWDVTWISTCLFHWQNALFTNMSQRHAWTKMHMHTLWWSSREQVDTEGIYLLWEENRVFQRVCSNTSSSVVLEGWIHIAELGTLWKVQILLLLLCCLWTRSSTGSSTSLASCLRVGRLSRTFYAVLMRRLVRVWSLISDS